MITNENKPINVGTRLTAMILDHFIMTIIAMVFFIPYFISSFTHLFVDSDEPMDFNFMQGPKAYVALFGFALYFCKDCINGRSIAKRILKLQVVDNKTGEVATPLQCFVRNIFCILWIIEVIVAITNTSRRIGDRVAGTKLVNYDSSLDQPKPNAGKIALPVIISYGLTLLLTSLLPSVSFAKPNYSVTSYYYRESKELEKLITDSLGQYMTPSIRVYDTVKNENLKYVSTILKLKENYISDEASYNELHTRATNLIYSKMSKETFTGQIKYVYQGNGQFQSRITTIGEIIHSKDDKP
jgi:Predicted membrane protein/domain